MKHATSAALDELEPWLAELRVTEGLKERSRGVFYRRSKAFLHFHEDPKGLYADLRNASGDFDRLPVNDAQERAALLDLVARRLTRRD